MGERVVALSEEELGSLFIRAQNGDRVAMEAALKALEPYTRGMCRRYERVASRDPALTFDDVLQQGRLSAIRAVNAWVDRGVHPRIYVTGRIRSDIRNWSGRAAETTDFAMSLDQPVGRDGKNESIAGEVFIDFACVDDHDIGDADLQELLDRVPQAAIGAGDDYLAFRLRLGKSALLPDDQTLLDLIRQGKTMDELQAMIGGSRLTIRRRLTEIRKSGIDVPSPKRTKGRELSPMYWMPWDEKLRIIKAYLDSHPGVSTYQATRDLGASTPTLKRARMELAQAQG